MDEILKQAIETNPTLKNLNNIFDLIAKLVDEKFPEMKAGLAKADARRMTILSLIKAYVDLEISSA